MKLDEVLKQADKSPKSQDHSLVYLHGAIEADHDAGYFRLYPNPHNRRSYLLVRRDHLAGELYQWTAEEARGASFVGSKIYRVPLMHGTEVQQVSVTIFRLGETSRSATTDVCCCNTGCTPPCGMLDPSSCDQVGEQCPGHC